MLNPQIYIKSVKSVYFIEIHTSFWAFNKETS